MLIQLLTDKMNMPILVVEVKHAMLISANLTFAAILQKINIVQQDSRKNVLHARKIYAKAERQSRM